MQDDKPVAEMIEVAASADPLPRRARQLVESLEQWAPSEAVWIALTDPTSSVYERVASHGLDPSVTDYLDDPRIAREIELTGLNRNRAPVNVRELPIRLEELQTWAECLVPAGFRGGLAVPLYEPGGLHVGLLSLLSEREDPPCPATRDRLATVSPLIARAMSPMRSLLATARIVQGATAGVVMLKNGTTASLHGLEDHALLGARSPVLRIARATLLAGQVYRSFMWPAPSDRGAPGHARLTVMAATDAPTFILGMVLVTPDPDQRGLTPRELQVLGLLVDGRSNQQIARTLGVSPRTVAAHVEHLLEKLQAPTRTLAAVRAEREGCYVPADSARPRARLG